MVSSLVSSLSGAALLNYYQGQAALTLLSGSSTSGTASASNSISLLDSYYLGKEGISSSESSSGSSSSASAAANAPAAPWNTAGALPSVSAAVQNAVDGQAFINPSAATLSAPAGASAEDYKNLFALYQGLNTLEDIAQTAAASTSSSSTTQLARLQTAFSSGVSQVQSFLSTDPFKAFNLTSGQVNTTETSSVGIPNGNNETYTTGVIATGDLGAVVPAFSGNVQFTISVQNEYVTTPTEVNINLADMGSSSRTMTNVVDYINSQLQAAGVSTSFSVANLGTSPSTTAANGSTIPGESQWGLTVNGNSTEAVSFSAPSTAAAIYVAQATGGADTLSSTGSQTTTATGESLTGLQTQNSAVGAPPSTDSVSDNNTNLPAGGIFSTGLPSGVTQVDASAVGSNGNIYMVANVTGSLNGSPVPGDQGVALLQYDAAGNLVSSNILSDGSNSSGYSLAVNSDGTVAVVGDNATASSTAADGYATAATTTAFLQVFSSDGAPSWSATIPAEGGSTTASGVVFGSDGSIYVSGSTTGSVGGQTPEGGSSDEYIQGFSSTGTATFTTQYGATAGDNTSSGIAYDAATNSLYTAGLENSQAVVRSFTLNGANAPTVGATQDLGEASGLVGIAVSGDQVLVGGSVDAATIDGMTVAQAYTGEGDGFVASISTSLTPSSSNTVSYVGTTGATTTATAMAAAGGQAYLTGTVANDPFSLDNDDATEGFVAGVDATTGAVTYSDKLAGANGQSAPSAIAVSATGTSVLDQFGLPDGPINVASSNLITANTPIQAGDAFYVRTSPGGAQTAVTVTATDTLASLATKLDEALGGAGTVTVQDLGKTSELSITPANSSSYIELDATSTNASSVASSSSSSSSGSVNVLAALGLNAGVIRTVQTIDGLTNPSQLQEYGLNLPTNLNISTPTQAKAAAAALQAAMGVVQEAYQALVNPPTMASEAAAQASGSGTVPSYISSELANYQAGLARLTAGSASSSVSL